MGIIKLTTFLLKGVFSLIESAVSPIARAACNLFLYHSGSNARVVTFVDPVSSVSALSFIAVLSYGAALLWLACGKRGRVANALFLGLLALGVVAALGIYYAIHQMCIAFHAYGFSRAGRFGSFNKGWHPGVAPWALVK